MKPLILVTNDDGIYSPCLWAAVEALVDIGELLVVAPIEQQTGMGRSFPKTGHTGIIENVMIKANGQTIKAYGVHGSPALAVSHGVLELCERKPDLCVSGINYGENLGLSITCSGTLGAAFEADSHGIPSIAVSRQADLSIQHSNDFKPMDWEVAKKYTTDIVSEVLRNGYPGGASILNVNVPDGAICTTEKRLTRQSRLNYSVFQKPHSRDFSKGFILKSQIDVDINSTEKDSDIYAFFFDKVISVTPLTWDLTAEVDWNFIVNSTKI